MKLAALDLAVIAGFVMAIVSCGLWFVARNRDSERYLTADRSLPGWAVGLSIFGSYISSISFLANPGKSYSGNWNPFVYNLVTPLAAFIAARWFVPFYRRSGDISAYAHLERRFGAWARTYAVVCYLLVQLARFGTILYLLAIAIAPLTGWDVWGIIVAVGLLMTVYTLAGGLEAVVWTGVIQSGVLIAAALAAIACVLTSTPGGADEIVRSGWEQDKFSLGSLRPSLIDSTVWVMLIYALASHLQNFGIDQSFVQRYITARSDREAKASIWLGALLYVPITAVFFLIGTGLFVFYHGQLGKMPPDMVFPHFIATVMPAGLKGLVIAGITAAAMDSNLNSMATLFLCDIDQRYWRPKATEREKLWVLYGATAVFGVLGTGVALAMIQAQKTILDAWWELAGICSGGILGLFLLGLTVRRAGPRAAAAGVLCGLLASIWMSVSPRLLPSASPWAYRGNSLLILAITSLIIYAVGLVVSRFWPTESSEPKA